MEIITLPRSYPPKFLSILDDVFEAEVKARDSIDREMRHYPSSASFVKSDGSVVGSCLRQLYYRATKEPESNPRDMTGFLQTGFGGAIHDFLISKLQKSKVVKLTPESSGRITVDPLTKEISFRLDALVSHKGDIGGLEI